MSVPAAVMLARSLAQGLAREIERAVAAMPEKLALPLGETRTAMLRAWVERQTDTFHSGMAAAELRVRREFCANTFREWKQAGELELVEGAGRRGPVIYRRKNGSEAA